MTCSATQVAFTLSTPQVKHERIWGNLTACVRWARGWQIPSCAAGRSGSGDSRLLRHRFSCRWGAQPGLGMRTRCPSACRGLGKRQPLPSLAAPTSPPGQAQTLHHHPNPVPRAQVPSCAGPQLSPYRLQLQPLCYPPLACRWQETAEDEDFTVLAKSQDSLDGRNMLKTLFKMPGMPHGSMVLPSGWLAWYLKHRGLDPSWGNLPGRCSMYRAQPLPTPPTPPHPGHTRHPQRCKGAWCPWCSPQRGMAGSKNCLFTAP